MDTIIEIVNIIAGKLQPLIIITSFVTLVGSGWAFLRRRLSVKEAEIRKLEKDVNHWKDEYGKADRSIKKLKDERNGLTRVALDKADQQVRDGNEENANNHLMEWLDLEAPLIAEVCCRLARWRLSAVQDEQHEGAAVPLADAERLITIVRALQPEKRQLRDLKYEILISKHNQDPEATTDDLMQSLADEYDNADPFILHKYAKKYYEAGNYPHALALFQQITDILKQTANPNDRNTLISQDSLASVLYKLDRLEESEKLHREAWEAMKKHLPPNDRDTLISQHNLAKVLHKLDRLKESEALQRKAWKAMKQHLPPDDPEIFCSQNCLAEVLRALKRPEEAEALATATAAPGDDVGESEAQPRLSKDPGQSALPARLQLY